MSFSSDAKEEMARVPCERADCAFSELSAAVAGTWAVQGMGPSTYRMRITAGNARITKRYFNFLKTFMGVTAEIQTSRTEALGGRMRYHLVLPKEAVMPLLSKLCLYDERLPFGLALTPPEDAFPSEEERVAFLRGAFLMCGTVTNPEKKYHLEFTAPNEGFAARVAGLLRGFGMTPGVSVRRSDHVVWCKRAEDIGDLLTLLGASGAMLRLEDARIRKDVRGSVNRQMNCDQSNIERAVQAAQAQAEDIRYLDEQAGLDKLSEGLRAVAQLRLEHPEASLNDLGAMLTPPLGKSGVRSRMAKIADIAGKLRCGEDTGL